MPTRLRIIFSGPGDGGRCHTGARAVAAFEAYFKGVGYTNLSAAVLALPVAKRLEWIWKHLTGTQRASCHFAVTREPRNTHWRTSAAHPSRFGLIPFKGPKPKMPKASKAKKVPGAVGSMIHFYKYQTMEATPNKQALTPVQLSHDEFVAQEAAQLKATLQARLDAGIDDGDGTLPWDTPPPYITSEKPKKPKKAPKNYKPKALKEPEEPKKSLRVGVWA